MKLFEKENREQLNTFIALFALALSIISLGLSQYQHWAARRGGFSIDVEAEHHGPISIVEVAGVKCFEAFARITITNQSERRISIESVDASMLNRGVLIVSAPVMNLSAVHPDGEKVDPKEIPIVAFEKPVCDFALETSFPKQYKNELEVPFTLESYEQKAVYIKVRSQILESPKVIEALEKILDPKKPMSSGQFLFEAIKGGYGRPVQFRVGDTFTTASGGPERAMLEVRVKSAGGIVRKEPLQIP